MWHHLIEFDLGVSPNLVGGEGFWMGEKTTVYFLPLPALVRGLLSIFNMGESAVTSILLAVFLFISASLSLWHSLYLKAFTTQMSRPKLSYRFGIVFFSICTPIISILAFPGVFWEAITWGAASLICAAALSVRLLSKKYDVSPSIPYLVFTLSCGATLFTRATFSFTSCWLFFITTLFFLYQERATHQTLFIALKKNKVVIANCLLFTLFLGCLLLFNFMKWGNPFEFYPIHQYKMFSEEELLLYKSIGPLNINRIPENFGYFFLPWVDNFSSVPPFIKMGFQHFFTNIGQFNYQEPTLPLTLVIPATILLFFIGLFSLFSPFILRQKWIFSFIPSLACLLIPVFFILTHHAQSLRYAGDFMPALVIFSQIGFAYLIFLNSEWHLLTDVIKFKNPFYLKRILLSGSILFLMLSLVLASTGPILQNHYWRTFMSGNQISSMQFNQPVSFQASANLLIASRMLAKGWYPTEEWGAWSKGDEVSSLIVMPPLGSTSKDNLSLKVNALVTPTHPLQVVEFWINNHLVKTVSLQDNADHEILLPLPSPSNAPMAFVWLYENILFRIEKTLGVPLTFNRLLLEIKTQLPASPKDMGLSQSDTRQIGIGIKSVEIKHGK